MEFLLNFNPDFQSCGASTVGQLELGCPPSQEEKSSPVEFSDWPSFCFSLKERMLKAFPLSENPPEEGSRFPQGSGFPGSPGFPQGVPSSGSSGFPLGFFPPHHDSRTVGVFRLPSRDLLPLPLERWSREEEDFAKERQASLHFSTKRLAAGAAALLFCVIASLNYLYCGRRCIDPLGVQGPLSLSQVEAIQRLERDVIQLVSDPSQLPQKDWEMALKEKRVSYSGETVTTARPLTWEQIKGALPEPSQIGSVRADVLCTAGVREYLIHPSLALKPKEDWPSRPKKVKTMICPGEEVLIAKGLEEYRLVVPLWLRDILSWGGFPLLNGLFGVGKGEYLEGMPEDDLHEILRLIMNLIPLNEICLTAEGDVALLPFAGQWSNLQLLSDQVLLWSAEDLRCFFYLFEVPPHWWGRMAFDLKPVDPTSGDFLVGRVLGMGWVSSVGIAQHIHRN